MSRIIFPFFAKGGVNMTDFLIGILGRVISGIITSIITILINTVIKKKNRHCDDGSSENN